MKVIGLYGEECDSIYSDPQKYHDLCHWSCAVVLCAHESQRFITLDCHFAAGLQGKKDMQFSPLSMVLYITIKSSSSKCQRSILIEYFENLQQFLPPQITNHEKELHRNHMLLRSCLTEDVCNSQETLLTASGFSNHITVSILGDKKKTRCK